MSSHSLLVATVGLLLVAAVTAMPLGLRLGPRAGYPLAVLTAGAAAMLVVLFDDALDGSLTVSGEWVPTLGADWSLRLDALGLVFALVVTVVGAVMLAYSPRYLHGEVGPARYYGGLTGFAAAMTLLVLAGDALVLYVGWEGTTLASFLLIASAPGGRPAAVRALLITFAGGLALLAALLMAAALLDTLALAELTDPARWSGAPLAAFLVLLVIAAAIKSVQVPFHVWLPAAMVAPTPVSAYLHAAAMVTAGFYLLLRFAAAIAAQPGVGAAIAVLGSATALFAAAAAMRRSDMKELLAYSTISQIGFMVVLVGVGTSAAIAGAVVFFIAHAGYKSALFLCAGVYDHALGAKSLPELAGAAHRLPLATGAVVLACLSMAGLLPTLGYVGKDEALKGLLEQPDAFRIAIMAATATALALTVAYSIRIAAAPFHRGDDAPPREQGQSKTPAPAMALWPAVLAVASVGLGPITSKLVPLELTPVVDAAVEDSLGRTPSQPLALWHGLTPAFITSMGTIAAGGALFALWRARGWWTLLPHEGSRLADALAGRVRAAGGAIERVVASSTPAMHLAIVFTVATGVVAAGLVQLPDGAAASADAAPRWAVALLIAGAAVTAAQTRDRLAALAALAALGFLIATWYVLHGAAQLAAVQLVIDGLTVALAMFVFRHLPREFPRAQRRRRAQSAAVALAGGAAFAGLSLFQRGRSLPPASEFYIEEARSMGSGNVVTSILSHYRGLDTLGEMTVIAVAALGVIAVLRSREQR